MRVKKILLSLLSVFFFANTVFSQVTGTITVQGDSTKFYPVSFNDGGWGSNVATTLEIGRSNIHKNAANTDWWGSIIAKVRFHTTAWGNGSNFIDVDLREKFGNPNIALIAGWTDVTGGNADHKILIWLRGLTPYYYKADYAVTPVVYDGVANPVTYQETNGGTYTFKTAPDVSVNQYGMNYQGTAYFTDANTSFFAGSVGVGTRTTGTSKLAVEGTIAARRVKVTQTSPWPDFVFDSSYQLPALKEVENYVTVNKHLPNVPSAAEIQKDGQDLGEMNRVLLHKVEEQTLYLIELKKESEKQQVLIDQLMKMVRQLKNEKK
jgi:hypothetical protein